MIGFALSNLGGNQLAYYLVSNGNRSTKEDIIIFYQNIVKAGVTPLFATMNIGELYGFGGVGIANDLRTARKLLSCPSPRARYFYVWDLEWIRRDYRRSYEELSSVYNNPRIELIARSTDHAHVIQDVWNRSPVAVVEQCDVSAIAEVVVPHDQK